MVPKLNLFSLFFLQVVSRVLFGIVGTCVAIRLITLTTVSEFLGPFKISLTAMGMDIVKFCIIYIVILLAFAAGLTRIYAPYREAARITCVREGGIGCDKLGTFAT